LLHNFNTYTRHNPILWLTDPPPPGNRRTREVGRWRGGGGGPGGVASEPSWSSSSNSLRRTTQLQLYDVKGFSKHPARVHNFTLRCAFKRVFRNSVSASIQWQLYFLLQLVLQNSWLLQLQLQGLQFSVGSNSAKRRSNGWSSYFPHSFSYNVPDSSSDSQVCKLCCGWGQTWQKLPPTPLEQCTKRGLPGTRAGNDQGSTFNKRSPHQAALT
jgi:hypothetical protein